MYNVSVGPSKIVAKTRRGISQNLENFQNFSRKPIDFDCGEVMNGPRPVFHTNSKKCSNSKQQEVISPQHEELIRFVSESWSKIFKQYESDGIEDSEAFNSSTSSSIIYYEDPEPNAFLQRNVLTLRTVPIKGVGGNAHVLYIELQRNRWSYQYNLTALAGYLVQLLMKAYFKPFDLESWWGKRLFNNITKSIP